MDLASAPPDAVAAGRRRGPRVGLVLGGGGAVGAAYHAGVLAALVFDLGWDPREANLVVGTSAGSLVGSMLKMGVPGDDIAAVLVDAPLREAPGALADAARQPNPFPEQWWRSLLRPLRVPHPRSTLTALHHLYRHRDPAALVTALAPQGLVDVGAFLAFLDDGGHDWPDGLWVTAVEEPGLRRTVFGRDSRPPLAAGVAASCAIPGVVRPVDVAGHRYVDGGVRSPTNADLLADRALGLDLVIVSSPMSGSSRGLHPARGVEILANRHLRAELQRLRRAEVRTVLFEPSRWLHDVMGRDLLDRSRTTAIVREAFLEAGQTLRERRNRLLLAGLADRATRPAA